MGPVSVLVGYYDFRLVALSILVSILAAYAALDLAERVTTAQGGGRLAWLYGGAAAMGIGIWAMHYVGMVAFHLPVPVMYDWPTVLLSLFIAILASGAALFIVSRPTMGLGRTIGGSIVMGSGIAGMHYIGMEAMRLRAMCVYSASLVSVSVLVAIVISFMALQLAFAGRQDPAAWGRRKIGSGLIMGLAIPLMHYVGMAAVQFVPEPGLNADVAHAVAITPLGLAAIVAATIIILLHVCMISIVNRRSSLQARQLFDSEAQLQAIFDSLKEGVIVLDRNMKTVRMNQAAHRILGSPDRTSSRAAMVQGLDLLLPSGEPLRQELLPSVLAFQGKFSEDFEVHVRNRETGQTVICEVNTAAIANLSGEIEQIIVSYRDTTERKRNEDAQSRLAAIVESSEDAIIGKDLNGIITSWNRGAAKIFGYQAEEMIGQSIQRLLPPGHEHEEDGILERIRRGETIEQLESDRQRKDGRLIQVSLMISPIRDSNNRIVGASKIARDVTEKKLLERQWRQSQKMEAIGQLTGGIAHDFNNLLAIVIGNLGLLERMVGGNEAAIQRLKPAQKAAARGADLTRRLLALASREDLNPANTLIEDAIQETIELAGRALGPEIKILTHSDPTVPAVYVDGAGLESALLNLAVNARDAMPNGGTLTISTHLIHLDDSFPAIRTGELKPGVYARVSVSDTGHGMSKETLERALEPFFTTKGRDKGTGLGLAMVYGFAKQSGGTVRLYSEEGYGTTVSLYLPLADSPQPTFCEVPPAQYSDRTGGTVLVVDDEPDLLEIAHAYLTEMGYSALRADNAASALNTLALYKEIDLMLTDIIMPGGMNGVELAEKARELSPRLKVIYSSGYPSDALVERNGTRIDGPMLRKPYQRADFAAIIQRTMGETVK
jgi:PAS domain S-box-containing protein